MSLSEEQRGEVLLVAKLLIQETVPAMIQASLRTQEITCPTSKALARYKHVSVGVVIGLTAINVPVGIAIAAKLLGVGP